MNYLWNLLQADPVPNASPVATTESQQTHVKSGNDTSCELQCEEFNSHQDFVKWMDDTQQRYGFVAVKKRSEVLKDSPIDDSTGQPLFPFVTISYICKGCKRENIPCTLEINYSYHKRRSANGENAIVVGYKLGKSYTRLSIGGIRKLCVTESKRNIRPYCPRRKT
jgi:hypothetical protein